MTRIRIVSLILTILLALSAAAALAGCSQESADKPADTAGTADAPAEDVATTTVLGESPEWVTQLDAAQNADQLFVIAAHEKTTAWVSMHQKDENGKWQIIMTTPGYIGKNGLGKTKEGDGMTPVGVYSFNAAFGIADDPGCAIPYLKVNEYSYWSGDTNEGMEYNKMVDVRDYPDLDAENSEHIVDYTREYQYCLNISYNEECTPGAGSAIFLHCLGSKKPYTGGCVAIPENQMKVVMQNVKSDCVVVIDALAKMGGEF